MYTVFSHCSPVLNTPLYYQYLFHNIHRANLPSAPFQRSCPTKLCNYGIFLKQKSHFLHAFPSCFWDIASCLFSHLFLLEFFSILFSYLIFHHFSPSTSFRHSRSCIISHAHVCVQAAERIRSGAPMTSLFSNNKTKNRRRVLQSVENTSKRTLNAPRF